MHAFRAALKSRRSSIAAVMIEPGARGGRHEVPRRETLAFIRQACDAEGSPCCLDEIMTGFGRAGSMFACPEQAGIVIDYYCWRALFRTSLPCRKPCPAAPCRWRRRSPRHRSEAFLSDDPGSALMHGPTYMERQSTGCAARQYLAQSLRARAASSPVAAIERQMASEL